MAKVHGVAGEWARVRGTVYGLWPLFLGVFASGFSVALFLSNPMWGAGLFVVSVLGSVWALLRGLRRVERFFRGARGEEIVSGLLRTLPESYHVFNDFLARGKHVDHVVVGPAGVYAIETKLWKGRVTIENGNILLDGQLPDRSPLLQALREADYVRSELQRHGWKGTVTPVLAFASNTFDGTIAELEGAVVLNASHLRASFETNRVVLPPAELERLTSLMENNP